MTGRTQVNVRLDRGLIEEIDRMALEDAVDRSEMARRLLGAGLAARRMRNAVEAYRAGRVSAWRAAEMAGVSLYEMLDRIHEEGVPHELDADLLDRIGPRPTGEGHRVHEPSAPYGAAGGPDTGTAQPAGSDAVSGIDDLRAQFRPGRVRILFVGESSPAGGTHFYRANSNLFHATREAFAAAFGADRVPDGPRFLRAFQERGCWLVDLADRPVNRLAGHEREEPVAAGNQRLRTTIEETRPDRIVAVKASIADHVRTAASAVDPDVPVLALPFPVRQWRAVFVRRLAAALSAWET
jgi:hypothetical protein